MSVTFTAAGVPQDDEGWSELDVNMSNSNAATIAATLGIDLDAGGWAGEMEARDFQGRILLALAIEPSDEGVPAHELPGPGARWIECGRRPGYVQERLGQLHELAQWAVDHGALIWWS